jgi:hypothetical protein
MSNIGITTKLEPKENSRTYYFPDGSKVELKGIIELTVRDSGTHRLKTEDGKLHIIPTGWNHIEIETTDWTI